MQQLTTANPNRPPDPAQVSIINQSLRDLNHASASTGETHRAPAGLLDQGDDFSIDLAAEDHLDHFHRGVIGHAQTIDKLGFDLQPSQNFTNLGAAPVNDYRPQADVLEQNHIDRKRRSQFLVTHGAATVFDDNGPIVEAPDIRQRLDQYLGFVDQFFHRVSV